MFDAIKRWISADSPKADLARVSSWAKAQGYGFKRVRLAREDEGFVVDGAFGDSPWRLEWGPPQRAYIGAHELRIRMELRLPSDLQMLLLDRALMELLEAETFERYTKSTQTQIDDTTPEEMRWLAMFPKVPLVLPAALQGRFGAVASHPPSAIGWIDAALLQQLELAANSLLRDAPPFVLMTLRRRLYLRMQLGAPDAGAIAQAISLFDVAAQSALRVAGMGHEAGTEWPSTGTTAWQSQLDDLPVDAKRR